MLNSKQRAGLKSLANTIDTVLQVGKGGVTENISASAAEALAARELIKGCVLETSPVTAFDAAVIIAEATGSEVVQVIGRRFVLYKRNDEKPVIKL